MGAVLERCGLAEDLLEGTGKLFGGVPGGLAYAVILVGAVLGAITGTVAASVITMDRCPDGEFGDFARQLRQHDLELLAKTLVVMAPAMVPRQYAVTMAPLGPSLR